MTSKCPLIPHDVAFIGHPNSGKTSLFNLLTHSHERVGNWAGVTVEGCEALMDAAGVHWVCKDLPGVYGLTYTREAQSTDEHVTLQMLKDFEGVWLNVVDATALERHLYLTLQCRRRSHPMLVVVTKLDLARQQGKIVSLETLSKQLQCPVVGVSAKTGEGLDALMRALNTCPLNLDADTSCVPSYIQEQATTLQTQFPAYSFEQILSLIEGDEILNHDLTPAFIEAIHQVRESITRELGHSPEVCIATEVYKQVDLLIEDVLEQPKEHTRTFSAVVDKLVLNRILGFPLFLGVMYCLFLFSLTLGGLFQEAVDTFTSSLFVDGIAHWMHEEGYSSTWIGLMAYGIGQGINTTLTFIPVIAALNLSIILLEESGYMSRAAFVIDRCMRQLGLPGNSFVPLVIGFGCNVPAISSSRVLPYARDRIITVMMSPFMSCGARLAIFTVFVSVFFPHQGHNVIFLLYIIGITMAVATGLLIKRFMIPSALSPSVIELPNYQWPDLLSVLNRVFFRVKSFVINAGKIIIPLSFLLGALSHCTLPSNPDVSVLSVVGKKVTPLFEPLGLHEDNWPATVALLSGVAAKEVVIGTLNALYVQEKAITTYTPFKLKEASIKALDSVLEKLQLIMNFVKNPFLTGVAEEGTAEGVFDEMHQRFDGGIGAFAYLLFILLYSPCMSVSAVMVREVGRRWTLLSILWTTVLAYGTATLFYQLATFTSHPYQSLGLSIFAVSMIALFIVAAYYQGKTVKLVPTLLVVKNA